MHWKDRPTLGVGVYGKCNLNVRTLRPIAFLITGFIWCVQSVAYTDRSLAIDSISCRPAGHCHSMNYHQAFLLSGATVPSNDFTVKLFGKSNECYCNVIYTCYCDVIYMLWRNTLLLRHICVSATSYTCSVTSHTCCCDVIHVSQWQ